MSPKLLIVDDDPGFRKIILNYLDKMGYQTEWAADGKECMRKMQTSPYDLLLVDFRLPDTTGLELVSRFPPHTKYILLTGYSDVKIAVKALKSGALDYLTKPIDPDEMLSSIRHALQLPITKTSTENIPAPKRHEGSNGKSSFVLGKSADAQRTHQLCTLVAGTSLSVLIQGETGTGKEYVARTVHSLSDRKDEVFLAVDCGVMSDSLFSSEFFGYSKGAFTDAKTDKEGYFEFADKGTLFLDEIGNMNIDMQMKLLRVLQEKKVRRTGSNKEIDIDVRVLAATNDDLIQKVKSGEFREDLYHRLNEFKIELTPIRNRKEDLPIFVDHFFKLANEQLNRNVLGIDEDAWMLLRAYNWPGNLREMKNMVRSAVLLAHGDYVTASCLPREIYSVDASQTGAEAPTFDLKKQKEQEEKENILKVLAKCNYNKSKACTMLGMTRKTLYNKLNYYNITY